MRDNKRTPTDVCGEANVIKRNAIHGRKEIYPAIFFLWYVFSFPAQANPTFIQLSFNFRAGLPLQYKVNFQVLFHVLHANPGNLERLPAGQTCLVVKRISVLITTVQADQYF